MPSNSTPDSRSDQSDSASRRRISGKTTDAVAVWSKGKYEETTSLDSVALHKAMEQWNTGKRHRENTRVAQGNGIQDEN